MAARITLDRYIVDSLMADLVGHDRQPSAFLVYLHLWCRGRGGRERRASASLQQIASDTGLSKSSVQHALRTLKRRRLVSSSQASATAVPQYLIHTRGSGDRTDLGTLGTIAGDAARPAAAHRRGLFRG
jgi:DNA-binding MarR family transcriptional regulator